MRPTGLRVSGNSGPTVGRSRKSGFNAAGVGIRQTETHRAPRRECRFLEQR